MSNLLPAFSRLASTAPSFNGRTADSGSAYRGSNPWGATTRYYTPSGRSVQEGGIDPDIRVPQLSDPDAAERRKNAVRESDLHKHLINEIDLNERQLEHDDVEDPRFSETPEQLKKEGIKDFQLHYALETLRRTSGTALARNVK